MSFKPEVLVHGTWSQNALVFATRDEATDNARALSHRWMLVDDYRAVESSDAVNYAWKDGQLADLAETV